MELHIIFSASRWQSWLFILFDEWLHSYSNFPIFWQRLWHTELSDSVYLSILFSDNACDISAIYKGAILYQSTVVSIETKENNANIIQMGVPCLQNKEIYQEPKKHHWEHEINILSFWFKMSYSFIFITWGAHVIGIVFKLFFLFPIGTTHIFFCFSLTKLAVYLVWWVAIQIFLFSDNVCDIRNFLTVYIWVSYFLTTHVTYQLYIGEQFCINQR